MKNGPVGDWLMQTRRMQTLRMGRWRVQPRRAWTPQVRRWRVRIWPMVTPMGPWMERINSKDLDRVRGDEGFTLIEVLVALAIIVIMGAFVGSNIIGRVDDARVTSAMNQMKSIELGLRMYRLDTGSYPTTSQGLRALVTNPLSGSAASRWAGPYLEEGVVPKDPWGNEYQYICPAVRSKKGYDLFSYGGDGREGGEGLDADVLCWTTE